jgi:uncharacterized cupin superfamily protein
MPNIYEPTFEQIRDHPGFEAQRAFLGRQLGARQLGMSLWEIDPGQAAYPYHFHLAEEELIVVLDGTASVRTPGGWAEAAAGEVLCFPVGEEGAHQLANRGSEVLRFLSISRVGSPEICFYPDSGKVGAFDEDPADDGFSKLWRVEDSVGYYEGETAPEVS